MWNYEKRLQFPVNIKKPDARAAQVIISQYGGPYISNLDVCFYLYNKMIQYSLPDCQSGRIFLSIWIEADTLNLYGSTFGEHPLNLLTFF